MTTLRRDDLAGRVSSKLGGTKAAADIALTAVVEVMEEALAKGHKVVLTGFGTFQVRRAKARMVRPIRGGDVIEVPPHDRVGFVPGASLRAAIGQKK